MNVPFEELERSFFLEILRKGKPAEYVDLVQKGTKLFSKLYFLRFQYEELIKQIYNSITRVYLYDRITVDVSYIGEDKVWKHALIVEDLSKQLLEVAGEIAQVRQEYLETKAKIQQL